MVDSAISVEECLSGLTFESNRAGAFVRVDLICAGSVVLAGIAQTLVNVFVAVRSGESGPAIAIVPANLVDTDSVVANTGLLFRMIRIFALVHIRFTLVTGETGSRAVASRSGTDVGTGPVVEAGVGVAGLDVDVAVVASQSGRASVEAVLATVAGKTRLTFAVERVIPTPVQKKKRVQKDV